jgi:hypothetical protein
MSTATITRPVSIRCAHCKGRHASVEDIRQCAEWEAYGHAEALAEYLAEVRYERWLEDGGAHADQIQWEHEQDRLRAPFDPQGA